MTKKKKKKGMIRFEGQEELPGNDTAADEEVRLFSSNLSLVVVKQTRHNEGGEVQRNCRSKRR